MEQDDTAKYISFSIQRKKKLFLCSVLWIAYLLVHTCDFNSLISCNWISSRRTELMDVKHEMKRTFVLETLHLHSHSPSVWQSVSHKHVSTALTSVKSSQAVHSSVHSIINLSCLSFMFLIFTCKPFLEVRTFSWTWNQHGFCNYKQCPLCLFVSWPCGER